MSSTEFLTDQLIETQDIEAALDPIEVDGTFRDSRQCAALALLEAKGQLLLSPPTPRPKKG